MSEPEPLGASQLDVELMRQIDAVCRRFEADWRAGARPPVDPYLAEVPDEARPTLRAELFERLEGRFSWIARGATLVVGASGFYMVEGFNLWDRFSSASYWWMHAMVVVLTIFMLLLFVAEPLFLHRWFAQWLRNRPGGAFALIARAHWFLLSISLLTVAGAVAGAHGFASW